MARKSNARPKLFDPEATSVEPAVAERKDDSALFLIWAKEQRNLGREPSLEEAKDVFGGVLNVLVMLWTLDAQGLWKDR